MAAALATAGKADPGNRMIFVVPSGLVLRAQNVHTEDEKGYVGPRMARTRVRTLSFVTTN